MFKIYTDGSCKGNPGPGGWGAIIILENILNLSKDDINSSINSEQFTLKNIETKSEEFIKNHPEFKHVKYYQENDNIFIEVGGLELDTTNNKMEMTAVIKSLQFTKNINIDKHQVHIFTDSTYVKDGIETWIHNWKKNGWKTAQKKPVKNYDLWVQIDFENSLQKIQWNWVKGHSGDVFNEKVDKIANQMINII